MMKVQQQIGERMMAQDPALPSAPSSGYYPAAGEMQDMGQHAYPSLGDYMGLEFSQEVIALNMPQYLPQNMQVAASRVSAPISGPCMDVIAASTPSNAVRQVVLCKDEAGKVGMRVKDINNGVFVCLVMKDSPAAKAGLRFGDQLLEIGGTVVAGLSMDKVHSIIRKCPANGITLAVRDRPFERCITLHKDSSGHIGFQFRDGKVTSIVKDSSAARNGMLTDHQVLEVNGQNVVGLKDKEITSIVTEAGPVLTVTIMPSYVYKHIVSKMASALTKIMDHSHPLLL